MLAFGLGQLSLHYSLLKQLLCVIQLKHGLHVGVKVFIELTREQFESCQDFFTIDHIDRVDVL